MLDAKRDVFKKVFLSILTLGIYNFVFIYKLAKDTNTVCAKDGKETYGLLLYLLLSFITFGIYAIVWRYKVVARYDECARRMNLTSKLDTTEYFLWRVLGSFIAIGPMIAAIKWFDNMNQVCNEYNHRSVNKAA